MVESLVYSKNVYLGKIVIDIRHPPFRPFGLDDRGREPKESDYVTV